MTGFSNVLIPFPSPHASMAPYANDSPRRPVSQPFTPRCKPVQTPSAVEWREWDRLGLVDAGVIDILAEVLLESTTVLNVPQPRLPTQIFLFPFKEEVTALSNFKHCGVVINLVSVTEKSKVVLFRLILLFSSEILVECYTMLRSGRKQGRAVSNSERSHAQSFPLSSRTTEWFWDTNSSLYRETPGVGWGGVG